MKMFFSNKTRNFIVFLLVVICLTACWIYWSNTTFGVTEYSYTHEAVTAPVRIVHLSDLHNAEFGKDNETLLAEIENQAPDLIFVTGDSVTGGVEEVEAAVKLAESLTKIAPVYFSYGNHELIHRENYGYDAAERFREAGVNVMEYSWEEVDINGQNLRIGGLYSYCMPARYLETDEAEEKACTFLYEFQDTDDCTLLLAHMPYAWIEHDGISDWDVDFVFSGHSHGGQIIVPILGSVYAPDQGMFPEDVYGEYDSADGKRHLIVSRGLGNSISFPRINNRPELVVIDILPEM